MFKILRSALVGVLSFVAFASLLGSSPRAEASPAPVSPDSTSQHPAVTLSTTQWKAAGYATKARNKAISADGSAMDYRKMKTIFGTTNKIRVDWRRQMA